MFRYSDLYHNVSDAWEKNLRSLRFFDFLQLWECAVKMVNLDVTPPIVFEICGKCQCVFF